MVDLPPPTGPINNRMRLRTSSRWPADLKYSTILEIGPSMPNNSSAKKLKRLISSREPSLIFSTPADKTMSQTRACDNLEMAGFCVTSSK